MEFTSAALPLAKPKRIDPLRGARGISISVGSAQHAYRILTDEATGRRIVVAVTI